MKERYGTGRCYGEEIGGTSIRTLRSKERGACKDIGRKERAIVSL